MAISGEIGPVAVA